MRILHIGGASLNQTPLDWTGNQQRIRTALTQARDRGVQLLCLPELCISGYGCEDAFLHQHITDYSVESLLALLPATKGIVAAIGLPLAIEKALYNCVALCADGRIISVYAKQYLAGDGIHYEPRWFKPWQSDWILWEHPALVEPVPITPHPMDIDGVRIGFEICEDAWVGQRVGQSHYAAGVDILLNPSASHFAFGKTHKRRSIVQEGSRAFSCTYVLANLVGNEAGRAIYDGEILIAQNGLFLAENERFSFEEVQLTTSIIDLDRGSTHKRRSASFVPTEPQGIQEEVDLLYDCGLPTDGPIALSEPTKAEELLAAEQLGLWDYMRKSRSRGFVVSLSGGADSAACALFASQALQKARTTLSEASLKEQAPYLEDLTTAKLLTCVYQATENSSEATLHSAKSIAEGIGATFYEWDVQPLFDSYRANTEQSLGRALSWEQDDLALQNIQARLRSPGIWMMANIHSALLLTTSNRSEAAVGYATMDGDTSGGLAPIGGLDKHYLRQWLHWAAATLGMDFLAPLNALHPTAELRPLAATQTDEKDLMPYALLDQIERAAIGEAKSPLQIFDSLSSTDWPEASLRQGIIRFFTLWSRNQWKRERYAPSFHLDDYNLDPRSWYRFPILSGAWQLELKELEATE